MGLMPAYRAAPGPVYSLKAVCIAPGNPARGLDSHQGFVALFDGVTGRAARVRQRLARSPRSAPPPCRRSRRGCSRGRGSRDARDPRRRRPGARRTSTRCGPCCRSSACASGAARLRSAAELRRRRGGRDAPRRRSTAPTSSSTATTSREPVVRREWLADGAHVNAVGSSITTTRELDSATMAAAALYVDRRESTRERVGRLPASRSPTARSAPDSIRGELGELLNGTVAGRTRRRRADGLQVARARGRGPRRRRARARGAPRPRAPAPRSSSDPARRDPPRARDDRRRRRPHAARPPRRRRADARSTSSSRRCSRSTRSRSAAPATRCCQALGRRARAAASSPRAPGTWRRASPTRRALRGVPATIVVPEGAPRDEARRRRAASAAASSRCRTTTGGA